MYPGISCWSNFITNFIIWELVGLCSYQLILSRFADQLKQMLVGKCLNVLGTSLGIGICNIVINQILQKSWLLEVDQEKSLVVLLLLFLMWRSNILYRSIRKMGRGLLLFWFRRTQNKQLASLMNGGSQLINTFDSKLTFTSHMDTFVNTFDTTWCLLMEVWLIEINNGLAWQSVN